MNRSYRRHRSIRALLFAGIVHLCLAITFMFSFYTPSQNRGEDALAVELIHPEAFREHRRTLKPPPPKKLRTPQQTDPSTDTNQRHLDLMASANLMDETMRQSEEALLHSATRSVSDLETTLPDVTTDAKRINSRETPDLRRGRESLSNDCRGRCRQSPTTRQRGRRWRLPQAPIYRCL